MLGNEWAMKLADNYGDTRGGNNNPLGNNQHKNGQSYVHNFDHEAGNYGNTKTYLAERIAKEYPDQVGEIGKGKKYRTVHAAAVGLGIIQHYSTPCLSMCLAHPPTLGLQWGVSQSAGDF